jgi:hypothetical protein
MKRSTIMAAMALSITPVTRASGLVSHVSRSPRLIIVDGKILSAGTYATGGVPLTTAILNQGITNIQSLRIIPPVDNTHNYVWDSTNQKLRIYNNDAVITGESLTATLGALTATKYLPSSVISVIATVNAAQVVYYPVPSSATLAAAECKVNYATGVITCYYDGSHALSSVTADYTTSAEIVTGDTLGADTTIRMEIWGY